MNFDMDCLRTFALVANTMSFSRAGESVHRSQSTVSQQINKLENQVGRRLFTRRKGRVLQLTPEGGRLLRYANRMLQLNDEAYLSISDDAMTGFVRLGVPLDFFGRDFTSWLAQFKIMHPMVGLQVEADQSEQLLRRIERGELDVAFFKQPTGAGHGRLVVREQLVWVACRNSLSSIDRSLPLILFPEGCAYRRFALSALREHGIAFHISFVGPSFECLKTAVVEGLGITVLARGLVSPPLRVLRHRIGLPPLPTVEVVYTFGNEQRPRVVTEFAHFLADSMINTGPPHLADAA